MSHFQHSISLACATLHFRLKTDEFHVILMSLSLWLMQPSGHLSPSACERGVTNIVQFGDGDGGVLCHQVHSPPVKEDICHSILSILAKVM